MLQLDGKVALVTGGSRGMGAAIAKRLAREGAAVALTYDQSEAKARAVADGIESAGGRALVIPANARDTDAVQASVEAVVAQFGRLDILVNNAGVFDVADIGELNLEHYEYTMDINVRAVFVATKAAAAHMGAGGRIIHIGSNLATRVPWPGISLYAMSKSALIGFTKGLARDLGPRGITVNVVHPGSTDTDMNPADGDSSGDQRALRAIEKFNDPVEVAALVTWLASIEARSVTGAEFTIDGGANA
jgi:3-oxoacyl-[acyl-carrier protein] reductase